MISASANKRRAYLVIGGGGVLLAAGYIALSFDLPLGKLNSPGAAIFPLIVGGLFLLGSLSVIWEGLKTEPSEIVGMPAGADLWRLLALAGITIGYVVLVPWIGQFVASVIFCALLMKLLMPSLSALGIIIRSLILMVPIHYLFIEFMRVPMPKGVFF